MYQPEHQRDGIKIDFQVIDGKILIKNKRYGIRQLYILSEIIKFLAITLIMLGILILKDDLYAVGIVNIILGIAVYLIGYMYSKIARTGREVTKSRRQSE